MNMALRLSELIGNAKDQRFIGSTLAAPAIRAQIAKK